MAKMMAPNTTIWWVTDPTFDPLAPKITLLTNARNISCAIATGYTLNPTDSNTDDTTTICDANNGQTPTTYNYEGNLTIFRDEDLEDTVSAFSKAWAFFKHKTDEEGYLVRRVGKLNTAPAAVGDALSSFKFIADNPQDVVNEDGPIQATIKFLKQGQMELYKPAVA